MPFGATVAVVSRGDDALIEFFDRRGWHFPQAADGRWTGYHPARSLTAIAQLEAVRARGADYLVVPSVSFWWFEQYADFERHLTSRYAEVPADPDACRIFALATPLDPPAGVQAFISGELLDHRNLDVLDLTTAGDLATRLPDVDVFTPAGDRASLPYADKSIPLVAVDSDDPGIRAEAARVASVAVLDVAADHVDRVDDRAVVLPPVSVVMPVLDNPRLTAAALDSLTKTLPPGFTGEIIVVDDHSAAETRSMLQRWDADNPSVRVVHNPSTRGYLYSLNRGLDEAAGAYLLLVNNDMVFLDGWLQPLLRTFADFPDAGAVGGRLLYPDGRLQEAGGVLFADGSAAKYGYGDADCGRPQYTFVRPVDYCSGCLLLTPRSVLDAVGGLDRSFDPGYYEDTDYCLRVRLSGRRVYYQPESVVVHVEGATAGLNRKVGMKRHQAINARRFVDKWGETLRTLQPPRPEPCDEAAMQALVLRHVPGPAVAR